MVSRHIDQICNAVAAQGKDLTEQEYEPQIQT